MADPPAGTVTPPLPPPALPATPGMIVTIPAHRETSLLPVLESLRACSPPERYAAVFALVNFRADADAAAHRQTWREACAWAAANTTAQVGVYIFIEQFESKHAGVGLARKRLMDAAAGVLDESGIIVCLDADAVVSSGYLRAIEQFYDQHTKINGASIYYEHPLDGVNAEAIYAYELHLRYYVECQRWLNLPYAFHTVGSSMSVRAGTYSKTGGMNRRKAGEDFYFLQKIIPHGFGTITGTTVFPSARISDRVPFGTGKAVGDFLKTGRLNTYAPASFECLRAWLHSCESRWNDDLQTLKIPPELAPILDSNGFADQWARIRRHSRTRETWRRHFYAWFDGFRLMKILHALRDDYFPDVAVGFGARWLLETMNVAANEDLLQVYRRLEKSQSIGRFRR